MKINLGDIVEIPSGRRGQVNELLTYWKTKYIGDNWIEKRTTVTVRLDGGETLKIADYQLTKISDMPESAG